MHRLHLVPTLLLGLGCVSSGPSVPYCGSAEPSQPLPTSGCQAREDTRRMIAQLRALVVPGADRQMVRVFFDGGGAPRALCVERGSSPDAWRARVRVGERAADVLALGPGPACLANTRLDLNRMGAVLHEVEEAHRECGEEVPQGSEGYIPGDLSSEDRSALFQTCLERKQAERDEIWVLDLGLVFVPGQDAVERERAVAACVAAHEPVDAAREEVAAGEIAARRNEMVGCLRGQGWVPAVTR